MACISRKRRDAVPHVEVLHVDTGLWCRTCHRTTGNRVTLAMRLRGGRLRLQQRYRCFECHGADVEAA